MALVDLLSVMTIIGYLYLITSLLTLIPTVVLFKQYKKTSVIDYLLFSGVFFTTSLTLLLYIINQVEEKLFLWQIRHFLLNTGVFFVFLHAGRLVWKKPPKSIEYVGVIWFVALQTIIALWQFMTPERARVLFFTMDPHQILPEPIEGTMAGFALADGTIIYSSSHPLLALLFYLFSHSIFIYAYLVVKPAFPTERIKRARILWILAAFFSVMTIISILLRPIPDVDVLVSIFIFLEFSLIAFTSLYYPEAMLLSHVQLYRAIQLYDKIKDFPIEIQESEPVMKYLMSLPSDMISQIKQTHDSH